MFAWLSALHSRTASVLTFGALQGENCLTLNFVELAELVTTSVSLAHLNPTRCAPTTHQSTTAIWPQRSRTPDTLILHGPHSSRHNLPHACPQSLGLIHRSSQSLIS